MAKIDLSSLEEEEIVGGMESQKIMFFGTNDVGKTYQSTKFDRPLLLMTENGGRALKCKKLSITKWSEFKNVVSQLTNEKTFDEMWEKYRTIIIDTAENLVDLSELATCQEFNVRDLSEIEGKQNGYRICRRDFISQINKLTSLGYTILFIAHEEVIEETDTITGEKYNFLVPKNSNNEKSSMRFLRDLCDYVIYLKPMGIDPETKETIPSIAICKRTKYAFARARFTTMPTFINPFTAQGITDAITKAVKKQAENEESIIKEYKRDTSGLTLEDFFELIKPYAKKLFKTNPNELTIIIEEQLGEGRKVTSATEDEISNVETIYNKLVSFCCERGIVVDIE